MANEIIINTASHEHRVAIIEDDQVVEVFVERAHSRGVVGNIYKGRVSKVLPGMQSAFVDIGLERDAFLYVTDVLPDAENFDRFLSHDDSEEAEKEGDDDDGEEGRRHEKPEKGKGGRAPTGIDDLLREGQEIIVQIAKEPISTKGARITTFVTLPGRYAVYMPTVAHVGVSRKIVSDAERARLRRMVQEFRRKEEGIIVRTVGDGKSEEQITADLRFLRRLWEETVRKAERAPAPSLIHRDLGLVPKLIRDYLGSEFQAIRVDDEKTYEEVVSLVEKIQPSMAHRVRLYEKDTPIFDEYGVQAEIENALATKVWLKSGGYIVINQTEALVAIDVNTGKYVGKKRLEDTVVKTNLEAVKEVVRHLRLRDMGGIIVIDFIDMDERQNRQKVAAALEQELRKDRARTKMLQISDFGLVEITRKRVKQSLGRYLSQGCPYCDGSGRVKSVETVCYDIGRELGKLSASLDGGELVIRAHPEVAKALHSPYGRIVKDLEARLRVPIVVKADRQLHHEQYDIMTF
ncbi:MAG: Rne/Rng family ribonuclease [Acidobacteriota bacterium]